MKISSEEIKELISGAVRFIENENGLMPIRFTKEQSLWYQKFPDFVAKVYASSGMRLDFIADAREIRIRYTTCVGSSRAFCYFDLFLDGILVQHCGTENRKENPEGVFSLKMDGRTHRITIYLPNLAGVSIREMGLLNASFVTPVKRKKKLLAYGDSITQGYDAHYPSFSYINRVADHFGWELINKAIGGDTFTPETGAFPEDFTPDQIFVAYGTNDWSHKGKALFEAETRGFFRNLRNRLPQTPLHVLLPVWREDHARVTHVGSFQYASSFIRNVCSEYNGIHVIDGFLLVPQLGAFFEDHYLHPNDMGFLLMADGVIHELEKVIK